MFLNFKVQSLANCFGENKCVMDNSFDVTRADQNDFDL